MSWYTSLCSALRIIVSGWCRYMRKPSLDSSFFSLAAGTQRPRWSELDQAKTPPVGGAYRFHPAQTS